MVQLPLCLQVLHLSAVFSIECMNHLSEKIQHLFTANRQFEKLMMNVVMSQADIHQIQPSESPRKVMRPSICGEIRKLVRDTHHKVKDILFIGTLCILFLLNLFQSIYKIWLCCFG